MTAWTMIGEFRFGFEDGRHFLILRAPDADTVRVDRQHPDPCKGRNVATATGLDTGNPIFTFPRNWDDRQRAVARAAIGTCWRHHLQEPDDGGTAAPAQIVPEVE